MARLQTGTADASPWFVAPRLLSFESQALLQSDIGRHRRRRPCEALPDGDKQAARRAAGIVPRVCHEETAMTLLLALPAIDLAAIAIVRR
jgi:hypothetical protein